MHPSEPRATRYQTWLSAYLPRPAHYRNADFLRGGLGALAGILIATLVTRGVPGGPEALPFIVAPLGASAVLLFAAPASPLAQPWPLVGGNVVSSLVGVLAARMFDSPVLAAPIAVGSAIALMMLLRCLHPPGGACALFASVGSEAVREHGFLFALWPVGVNTICLLVVAVAVNNLTGRAYPHVPDVSGPPAGRSAGPVAQRLGVQPDDVEAAIEQLDQGFDIMPGDVVALLRGAEAHALHRRLGGLRVDTVMTPDPKIVRPDDYVSRARTRMITHHVKALPVVDPDRRLLGIVTMTDLFVLDAAARGRTPVRAAMTIDVASVRGEAPVGELLALMTDRGFRHVPVLDDTDRLVGIVTRTELIAVLHRALLNPSAAG